MYKYNEQIEQAFLGAVLIDNDIIKKTILTEEDFEGDKTQLLFRMFKVLVDSGKELTPLIFKTFVDKKDLVEKIGYEIIFDISESYELGVNYKIYENKIKEYRKEKQIKQIQGNITKENLSESIKQLNNLEEKEKEGNTIVELANGFEKFREDFKKQGGLGYKGPFEILDKYVGGVISGKVYTIVAYSGVGKSNFSYSYVTDALKKGKKVVCFSLEVQKEMLFNSLLKSYYNVNQTQILKEDFVYDLGDFENLIVYDNIYKLQEIKTTAKEDAPDLIFIDFIQNIQVQGNSEYEKMTTVAQELQQLAIESNITVFNISQANNESRFKESNKIQPKGSGAIFASSDIIFALSRDGANLQLNLLKNKYGPSDKNFVLVPNFRNLQFKISKELQSDEIQKEETDFNL